MGVLTFEVLLFSIYKGIPKLDLLTSCLQLNNLISSFVYLPLSLC